MIRSNLSSSLLRRRVSLTQGLVLTLLVLALSRGGCQLVLSINSREVNTKQDASGATPAPVGSLLER